MYQFTSGLKDYFNNLWQRKILGTQCNYRFNYCNIFLIAMESYLLYILSIEPIDFHMITESWEFPVLMYVLVFLSLPYPMNLCSHCKIRCSIFSSLAFLFSCGLKTFRNNRVRFSKFFSVCAFLTKDILF